MRHFGGGLRSEALKGVKMMDYNKTLYDFIYNLIKNLKYAYQSDFNATDFKSMAEKHYGFEDYPLADWQLAFEWAIADVFGGGCEVETI